MILKINKITFGSVVDGPGKRNVVFVQGCTLACPFCQNKALWDSNGGTVREVGAIARELILDGLPVTISGGEPMQQVKGVLELVKTLLAYGITDIILYTGYRFEDLVNTRNFDVLSLISKVRILVDGPFIKSLDDPYITYRGSRNQRPINIRATLELGLLDNPVVENWDNELVLLEDGNLILPDGWATEFSDLGTPKNTRMCGQTKELKNTK